MIHVNVRGLKSKIKDISSLAEDLDLDVMIFTETKLSNKESRKISGYGNFHLTRNTRAGGVSIYYKNNLDVKPIKKNKECETLWIKVIGKHEELVIGGIYSPCEDNISKQNISNFVRELEKDFAEISLNNKCILILGDMNAHMRNDEQGIFGNDEKIGTNGKEYRRFLKENELILCNNTEKCRGKWTRSDGDNNSILDLTIATKQAYENMVLMEIDEENKYSIESKRAKTDHNVTYIKMDIATEKAKERKREAILCNGNWERYNNTIEDELKKHKEVSYNELEQAIQKASKEIINKRYYTPKPAQIFGYNEEIKQEIKKEDNSVLFGKKRQYQKKERREKKSINCKKKKLTR